MTIVELIDAHDGFDLITSRDHHDEPAEAARHDQRSLAFFLSAVLDNLTTAIVMMSLVRKLVSDDG